MPVPPDTLRDRLYAAFPDGVIELDDYQGDQDHYRVVVESWTFSGKTRIQQHKMVHQALGSMVGGQLHALTIETKIGEKHDK